MSLTQIETMRHTRERGRALAPAAVLLLTGCTLLTGCSGAMASPATTAEEFEAALSGGDYAAACRLLTPAALNQVESGSGQPCPDALEMLEVPASGGVASVQAWGRAAIVEFEGDTLFLARTGESWAVRAAGCSPVPEAPYDCTVEGG